MRAGANGPAHISAAVEKSRREVAAKFTDVPQTVREQGRDDRSSIMAGSLPAPLLTGARQRGRTYEHEAKMGGLHHQRWSSGRQLCLCFGPPTMAPPDYNSEGPFLAGVNGERHAR